MNEKLLIDECLLNLKVAQRKLFDSYYDFVFKKVYSYLSNAHDTEDIVLQVFNKIFQNLPSFEWRGEGSLKKWISTIAINQSLSFLKQRKPIVHFSDSTEMEDLVSEENVSEFDDISADQIMVIIEKMPSGYKTIFLMNVVDEYTHSEIAEILNISRNTSKSQLLKAKKYILNELNKMKSCKIN
ncbi:MAG: sigma-70 family RNA polymerase sigma factor [Saprospiraceae bacterium]|nr:sigma-70 family RNA polymerase sigma factor [Saprospiraceae bacterium]